MVERMKEERSGRNNWPELPEDVTSGLMSVGMKARRNLDVNYFGKIEHQSISNRSGRTKSWHGNGGISELPRRPIGAGDRQGSLNRVQSMPARAHHSRKRGRDLFSEDSDDDNDNDNNNDNGADEDLVEQLESDMDFEEAPFLQPRDAL
ncbi:hypothetical protein CANCADRAFT_32259 [Tortispora caseinolytica NRRL Y-17796]|uniref:Damage-regulated import facilitator 1 n=1 Tax=Tortispora caseinolytica NRRL Y-17796 TaxID=767744 RepID=A0A1E4TAJ1_9ASCO|nr:hypothetical protein CANCADRAFT_32259 [Tortispora caseinolytica NRRL Y-17796]